MRKARADQIRRDREEREAAIRAALARPTSRRARVIEERNPRADRPCNRPPRQQELIDVALARAPRIVDDDTVRAFKVMAQLEWIRPLAEWQPEGKGTETIFRSLAEHLFARYRMPPVLWTVFTGAAPNGVRLGRVVAHVAAGGSLLDAVRAGLLPVPLTRRMCHEILTRPGEATFLAAIRRAQVRAAGGSGASPAFGPGPIRAASSTSPHSRSSGRR